MTMSRLFLSSPETKNRLAREFANLKQEYTKRSQTQADKIQQLEEEIDKTMQRGEDILQRERDLSEQNAQVAAASHLKALNEQENKMSKVEADIQEERRVHLTALEEQTRKGNEEVTRLRNRIAQLQGSLSARTTSNMDIYANKLQETRAEFENKLVERDKHIASLEEELSASHEAFHHQQLLTVVRSVTVAANLPNSGSPTVAADLPNSKSIIVDEESEDLPNSQDEPTPVKKSISKTSTPNLRTRSLALLKSYSPRSTPKAHQIKSSTRRPIKQDLPDAKWSFKTKKLSCSSDRHHITTLLPNSTPTSSPLVTKRGLVDSPANSEIEDNSLPELTVGSSSSSEGSVSSKKMNPQNQTQAMEYSSSVESSPSKPLGKRVKKNTKSNKKKKVAFATTLDFKEH